MDYPRVTEVLRAFTGYEHVPADTLRRAAERGTTVHAICAGIAKGAWIPETMIDADLLGYVNSFRKWATDQVAKFVAVEQRYQDDEKMYTGQLDFVLLGHDDKLYLADLKTSSRPQKTYPVQMAAYDYLLERNKIQVKGAMLVYLQKDGDYPKLDLIDDLSTERSVFFSALECYHYFHGKQICNNSSCLTKKRV